MAVSPRGGSFVILKSLERDFGQFKLKIQVFCKILKDGEFQLFEKNLVVWGANKKSTC